MADLESLRKAYRESGSDHDVIHLSEDRWERLACDELTTQERESALDHILTCRRCSDTYRALHTLRTEAPAFDPGAPVPAGHAQEGSSTRRRMWSGMGLLALAAAVTLAIVLPTFNPTTKDALPGPQVLRSTGEGSPAIPLSPVDEVVYWQPGIGLELRWTLDTPAPAVIEILDADGELLWSGPETTATEIGWPTELPANPGRYYWRVVVTGDGDKKVSSALASFELTANPL